MNLYAAMISFVENMEVRREPYRAAHLEHLRELHRQGKLLAAGAWRDRIDGSLLIFKADSREEVQRMLDADPYNKADLWTGVTVREWGLAVGGFGQ